MSELRRRTVTGVLWSGSARAGQQAIQFAVTVTLARLLVPADFGLVAMVAVFSGFATLLVDLGLGAAIVQRKELEPRHLSSAFWLNVAVGTCLTLLVAAAAPGIAALYGEPRLTGLTLLLSLSFVLASPVVVQTALLQRSMNFRRIAAVEVAAAVAGGSAAIASALAGVGAKSLVVQILTATVVRGALLWRGGSWRPELVVDRDAVRELWSFGGRLAGFSALNYWSRNADNLLVGRFVGAAGLGIYSRAYSTMLLPLNQISNVVTRVMFPALSRIQDDPDRVRRAYLRAVGIVALVTFPVLAGLLVVAEPFVLALYGPRWADAVPILQILCVAGLTQSVGTTVGWIYQSQGRTDWLLRWGIASTIVTVAAFAVGVRWGVTGVAVAYAARTLALTYFNFSIPGRLIGMSFTDVLRAVGDVAAAAAVMAGTVAAVGVALPPGWPAGAVLATQTAVGIVVYWGAVRLLPVTPYRELRTIVGEQRRGKHALGMPA